MFEAQLFEFIIKFKDAVNQGVPPNIPWAHITK